MSVSQEILSEMREELKRKQKAREGVLDRLALVDIEIDQMDGIITNIDKEAVKITGIINQSINPVKDAYDARIAADCRTDLIWEKGEPYKQWVYSGAGDGATLTQVTFTPYEVKKNAATYDFEPFQGVKYYQNPSNRDYGASVIAEFSAYVSQGSTVVGIVTGGIPSGVQLNDTLVDSFDAPEVFTTGDLPEITGFGTTDIVGILTTLVCGIDTGSNILVNFGAGDISMVSAGMIILEPEVTGNTPEFTGIFTTNGYTRVVGFGSTAKVIEYYDSAGILTTSTLSSPTLILDKPALNFLEEGAFRVGILTQVPALFISTAALVSYANTNMYVIRANGDIDANFDYLASPNSPQKIGILNSNNAGIGNSAYYDDSGNPNKTEKWDPGSARDRIKIEGAPDIPAIKEPKVGAGRAEYNIGTTQWPTLTSCTISGGETPITTCSSTYSSLGTKVTIGGTVSLVSIGYTGTGPSGKNPSGPDCQSKDAAIQTATNNMNSVISANKPQAEQLVSATAVLRKRRSEKEVYAWSLLSSAARLREEIKELKQQISEFQKTDFSKFDKPSK